MAMTRFLKKVALLAGGVASAFSIALAGWPAWATERVDVELVLAVDVSGSVNHQELRIQREGYVGAFRSSEVIKAIERGLIQSIAVTYVEWAGTDLNRVVVPWTKIANKREAYDFAAALENAPYSNMSSTSIASAIRYSTNEIETNQFEGIRKVVDISGDGPNNQGGLAPDARDEALMAGIIINGLPLMTGGKVYVDDNSNVTLDSYYQACVIGGPGSFVLPVDHWDGFAEAVRRKIVLELAHHPVETGLPLQKVQFLDLNPGIVDCYIGEKIRAGALFNTFEAPR
ncbi:MAG: DUF1194 domain-containing protein [Pseudomonadota bacterium]